MKKVKEYYDGCDFSKREFTMAGIILFLLGIIVGIIFSPKHSKVVGCYNGNNNIGEAGAIPKKEKKCKCKCDEEEVKEVIEKVLEENAPCTEAE